MSSFVFRAYEKSSDSLSLKGYTIPILSFISQFFHLDILLIILGLPLNFSVPHFGDGHVSSEGDLSDIGAWGVEGLEDLAQAHSLGLRSLQEPVPDVLQPHQHLISVLRDRYQLHVLGHSCIFQNFWYIFLICKLFCLIFPKIEEVLSWRISP